MRHVARNSRSSDAMNVRIKDYERKVDVLTRELNATRNQTNRSDLMSGATGRKFGDIEVRKGFANITKFGNNDAQERSRNANLTFVLSRSVLFMILYLPNNDYYIYFIINILCYLTEPRR